MIFDTTDLFLQKTVLNFVFSSNLGITDLIRSCHCSIQKPKMNRIPRNPMLEHVNSYLEGHMFRKSPFDNSSSVVL